MRLASVYKKKKKPSQEYPEVLEYRGKNAPRTTLQQHFPLTLESSIRLVLKPF